MVINRVMILFSGCFLIVWSTFKWKIPNVIWNAKLTKVCSVALGLYNIILAICFEKDLNIILKDLKEENFFVYLLLEFATIKKVTFIPTFNSSNPIVMPYLGFLDWFIISNIKNYIDNTFNIVKDDYYQIVLLKDENQGINFEVYATVTVLEILFAIIKNFKVFLKLFKKKEKNYE